MMLVGGELFFVYRTEQSAGRAKCLMITTNLRPEGTKNFSTSILNRLNEASQVRIHQPTHMSYRLR